MSSWRSSGTDADALQKKAEVTNVVISAFFYRAVFRYGAAQRSAEDEGNTSLPS